MLFKSIIQQKNEGYYFPLYNQQLKSSITPQLLGDLKLDFHRYLLEPISERGLFESFGRHVLLYIDDETYTLSGKGHLQQNDTINVSYYALYQEVKRSNPKYRIKITSFIPSDENIELHEVIYKNTTNQDQRLKVVVAIPLYGRSAENIHDHRHVTSLLNQTEVIDRGILLTPTLSFDERGHLPNQTTYGVFSNSEDLVIEGYYPCYDTFVDGGSLLYPKGMHNLYKQGDTCDGYEALGGIAYQEMIIKPNEEICFYFGLSIGHKEALTNHPSLLKKEVFHQLLKESIHYFKVLFNELVITLRNEETTRFLSFVPIQPTLRRLFGNSYLPHHDYGKGGRGWRDLFQDLIYLILIFDKQVKDQLISHFRGVRIDGSNATIIGEKPGEFRADRNNITRIWSDHGAWPLFTLDKYINAFNDQAILLEKGTYFNDQFSHFTKQTKPFKNSYVTNKEGPYKGTILEKCLLQTFTNALNLGASGFVKLEDADWNDGLDMASEKGETIAFTHFYLNNLKRLRKYISTYETIELFPSLYKLITSRNKDRLNVFFDEVKMFDQSSKHYLSNRIIEGIDYHIDYLESKLKTIVMDHGALQSYIDNDGLFLDKDSVSLTGQAMALLSMTIPKEQADIIAKTTKKHLYNYKQGGYHLNEDYKEVKLNMGRAYGFRYNHKENGAVFSHMALMYVSGLFNYKLTDYAREGLYALMDRAMDNTSLVPLGIPEYFTEKGIGKYFYLTGSATWLLLVIKESLFGIKYHEGKTYIIPQLSKDDFIDGYAEIKTIHYGKETTFKFYNKNHLDRYNITIKAHGQTLKQGFDRHYKEIEVHCHD